MTAAMIEFFELWALENVIIIDGGAYAPFEPLLYAMYDIVLGELVRICCIVILIVFVIIAVLALFEFLVLTLEVRRLEKKDNP